VIAARSAACVLAARSADSRSVVALSASAWSCAFARSAASIAARSADVFDGVGAAATRWREQALPRRAIEIKEIERIVLRRMSPFTVKIRYQDDYEHELATRFLDRSVQHDVSVIPTVSRAWESFLQFHRASYRCRMEVAPWSWS